MLHKGLSYLVLGLLSAIAFYSNSFAQTFAVSNIFSLPIDTTLVLAGTFGEIRSNHFHSGIDIGTGGFEGKRVLAAADGYISRIKISSEGFGKALYITHPNGYVTVYGHLQRFDDSLEKYVRAEQYKRESFEIEMFPGVNEFVFKKGDFIAYSGNTGGSAGPHLHFEIRDGKTEEPIEPLSSGLKFKDSIAPQINSFTIFPLKGRGNINGTCDKIKVPVILKEKIYSPDDGVKIILSGETGFGIEVSDKQMKNGSEIGIKRIELFIDERKIYDYSFDRFRFDESRYVNANIDYKELVLSRPAVMLCYRLPGNEFSMTKKTNLTGVMNFNTDESHTGLFRVYDFNNNIAQASFSFISTTKKADCADIAASDTTFFIRYNKPFSHETDDVTLRTDKLPAVYEDTYLVISKQNQKGNYCSGIVQIGVESIPVHNAISISIKPDKLPESLKSKALIIRIESNGKISSAGGNFLNGLVTAKIRSFGNYAVAVDSVPPVIQATNLSSRSEKGKLKFIIKIKDELSGIDSYRATINMKWMLMEYDAKSGTLSGEVTIGKREKSQRFVLTVTDKKGNKSQYTSLMKY